MDSRIAPMSVSSRTAAPVAIETETGLDLTQPIASVVPEKFIAVDRKEIIARLLYKEFKPAERPLAEQVIRYMCALRQVESAETLNDLVECYDAFNPDDETVNSEAFTKEQLRAKLGDLKAKVVDLVDSANFLEIGKEELTKHLEEDSTRGFAAEVDLCEYDFHLLYYRGAIKDRRLQRSWKRLWLFERPEEVDAYRRLFLALKLKPKEQRLQELMQQGHSPRTARRKLKRARGHPMLEGVSEETLHLKVFRRIPRDELRILFPNARIKFKLFDKLWLYFGSGGSTAFALVTAVVKILALAAVSAYFLIVTLAGALGAITRSFTNFLATRNRYMVRLAKSLYFHALASNQSVLTLLTDDAEEEDIKEAALTYCFLLQHGHRGLSGVRAKIIDFLKAEFGVDCAFDIEDGCVHLRKLGLLIDDEAGSRILDLPDAHAHLIRRWQAAA